MASRSQTTREKLISAGRRRFAEEGWTTARVRDIIADAEQSNDSAINYHFGSRAGLLQAILRIGVESMEEQRRQQWARLQDAGVDLSDPLPIRTITDLTIRPLADQLQTREGLEFIRVVGQLGPYTSVPAALQTDVLKDTILHDHVDKLFITVETYVDRDRANHRVHHFLIALISILAARARMVLDIVDAAPAGADAEHTVFVDMDLRLAEVNAQSHQLFVDDLILTLSAALVET